MRGNLTPQGWKFGPVVYPANAFDSRQRGDWVTLGSSRQNLKKKKTHRDGPARITTIFSLPFFLLPFRQGMNLARIRNTSYFCLRQRYDSLVGVVVGWRDVNKHQSLCVTSCKAKHGTNIKINSVVEFVWSFLTTMQSFTKLCMSIADLLCCTTCKAFTFKHLKVTLDSPIRKQENMCTGF